MKIKKIILTSFIILLCGCHANYEIRLEDDKVQENLDITIQKNETNSNEYNQDNTKTIRSGENDNYYNYQVKENTDDKITINYNYEFDKDSYNSSYIARNCFSTFKYLLDDEKYYLFAQGNFKCLYYKYTKLDTLDIKITTNHNVLENNADEIKEDEYIWHVNLENLNDIKIKFVTDNKINKTITKKQNTNIIIAVASASAVILILLLLLYIRHKRVNKI